VIHYEEALYQVYAPLPLPYWIFFGNLGRTPQTLRLIDAANYSGMVLMEATHQNK